MDEDGDVGGDEDYEDYGGSDDDDMSWKIRKAALKVIAAVIASRSEMFSELFGMCAQPLIRRFKEREENVRLDVINCIDLLLRSAYTHMGKKTIFELIRSTSASTSTPRASKAQSKISQADSVSKLVTSHIDVLIKASNKQFAGSSMKTKSVLFLMFISLMRVVHVSFSFIFFLQ